MSTLLPKDYDFYGLGEADKEQIFDLRHVKVGRNWPWVNFNPHKAHFSPRCRNTTSTDNLVSWSACTSRIKLVRSSSFPNGYQPPRPLVRIIFDQFQCAWNWIQSTGHDMESDWWRFWFLLCCRWKSNWCVETIPQYNWNTIHASLLGLRISGKMMKRNHRVESEVYSIFLV